MRRQIHYYSRFVLSGEIVEQRSDLPFLPQRGSIDLRRLLEALEAAVTSKAGTVILILKNLSIGWSQIEEIHRLLEQLKEAGKECVVFLEVATNRTFYLALGASRIFMTPAASLELTGLRSEQFFLKNLLELLGVQPHIAHIGAYKSAGEIFSRQQMSDRSREMLDSILEDIQGRLREKLDGRCGPSQDSQRLIDEGPYTPEEARQRGLIDGICYEDELCRHLFADKEKSRELPLSKLLRKEGFFRRALTFRRPRLAYLVLEGMIVPGESRRTLGRRAFVGAETVARQLKALRKSRRVKAVVLRINSPGGSAPASDLIWREVLRTDREKPVIATFSNVSASGGYYISVAARKILAMPSTLTGSIGIIRGKFEIRGFLEKLGITVDWIDKGRHAGYESSLRPFSQEEEAIVEKQMRWFYEELFLKKVAEGREQSLEEVRKVAEGRVWTGAQARQRGLLDEIGGVLDALQLARREAGLAQRRVRVVAYGPRRSLRDLFSLPGMGPSRGSELLALMAEFIRIR